MADIRKNMSSTERDKAQDANGLRKTERMISRKDQMRMAKQRERAAMTMEEKEERRAKDRERKAKMIEAMKGTSSKEKEVSKKYYDEKFVNKMYKRKIRENQRSKELKELRKIEHVIQMRKHRATRIEENIAIEKRLAKEDMKHMRKFGKVPTHCSEVSKYTANVPRKKRLKDEDEIWKNYCKENEEQKKFFETMKPGTAAQLKMNEQKEEEYTLLEQ